MPNVRWQDDTAQAWQILQWQGGVQWFAKHRSVSGGRLHSCDALIRTVQTAERLGWNLYLGLNPTVPCGIKAKRRHVTHWRFVCIDLDPIETRDTSATVGDMSAAIGCAHNLYSGRGYQWWLELDPHVLVSDDERRLVERATGAWLRDLEQRHPLWKWKIDTSCSDLPRVARCPGSVNQKTGQRSEFVRIGAPQNLGPEIIASSPPEPERVDAICGESAETLHLCDVLPHLNMTSRKFVLHGTTTPGRHAAAYATAAKMNELGVPQAKAEGWVLLGAMRCIPPLQPGEAKRTVQQAYS